MDIRIALPFRQEGVAGGVSLAGLGRFIPRPFEKVPHQFVIAGTIFIDSRCDLGKYSRWSTETGLTHKMVPRAWELFG